MGMSKIMKPSVQLSLGLLTVVALVTVACRKKHAPLEVASYVDINRYAGEWYEIARLPVYFQKDCYATKARYTLQPDGTVAVYNTCRKGSVDGKLRDAEGKAYVVDTSTNAKLKVQFFWPFKGDYWILDVGKEYEYAVVGEPARENLWILSRQTNMDQNVLSRIVEKAKSQGFDTSQLIYTEHQ